MRKRYVFSALLLLTGYMGISPLCAAKTLTKPQAKPLPYENVSQSDKKLPRTFNLTPPKKWQCIDDKEALPVKVDVVYVGTSKKGFTPSINVATEKVSTTLSQYVNVARKYHESQPDTRCHDLGSIQSKAGAMHLIQIDKNSEWGNIRFLQASIIDQNTAYVFTATCLEEEYENYYSPFLQAIQSFEINHSTGTQK